MVDVREMDGILGFYVAGLTAFFLFTWFVSVTHGKCFFYCVI